MHPAAPRLKRLAPRHWVAVDAVVAVLLVLVTGILWRHQGIGRDPRWAEAAVVVAAVLVAAFRRWLPPAVLATAAVVGAAVTTLTASPAALVAAMFVTYLVPVRFDRRAAVGLLVATLAASAAGVLGVPSWALTRPHGADIAAEYLLLIAISWTVGYAVSQQRGYAAARQAQAERAVEERLAEARRAMTEERLRIARELHDVIAHTLSVIAVQAGVANHVAGERPDEPLRVLASIEHTSREALREMRALLEVMRAGGGPLDDPPEPAPGLADVGGLVARAAEAGVAVRVNVTGERPQLSAGVDLAAYRVVQEAVTNVIKHAGTGECVVGVAYEPAGVRVTVTDAGAGTAGAGAAVETIGHGIAGMRERVTAYGGRLDAGPRSHRGFEISATFPAPGAGP
jgi:signal transduction histidine kinase